MLYEVIIFVESRGTARLIAKQLVSSHLASKVEITLCDIVDNSLGEVLEYSRAKLTCLTTQPNAIRTMSEAFKQENILISLDQLTFIPVEKDEVTVRNCVTWCGEETEAESTDIRPAEKEPTSLEKDVPKRQKRQAEHKSSDHKEIKAERSQISSKAADEILTDVKAEKFETSEEPKGGNELDVEEMTEQSPKKKGASLPKWAVEQGLAPKEYASLRDWRVAARWGMDYPDYCRAGADSRKLGIPLKKYLERIGKKHNPDLDVSFITLEYINAKKAENNKVTNNDETDITEW